MNKQQKQARLAEIGVEVERVMKNNTLTVAQKMAFMDKVEPEAEAIVSQLNALKQAGKYRNAAEIGFQKGASMDSTTSTIDNGQRLSFKGMGAEFASKIMGDDGMGRKALASSGAAVVGQEFQPNPIALGQVATSLLDLLPATAHDVPNFAYLRQTTRTNNAAVVADGAVKPTSVYSVTRIESSLSVIAHLSEAVPRYWLSDNADLSSFITSELHYGLSLAVEAKIFADINAASGIETQAFATSVLTTLRKGVTKLELAGLVASSIVLAPADWETLELALSTTNAIEFQAALPYDPATRRLWGIPVVSAVAQTTGVGFVLARDAVGVDVDNQGVQLQWSENSNATDFSENLIRARLEGRYATSVFKPLGVVVCDLTA
jgi:HK97 family phage major capsid protein